MIQIRRPILKVFEKPTYVNASKNESRTLHETKLIYYWKQNVIEPKIIRFLTHLAYNNIRKICTLDFLAH